MAKSIIDAGIAHTIAAIRKFATLSVARWGLPCETRVSARHVRWLALTAFERVLQRKQVPFTDPCGLTKRLHGPEQVNSTVDPFTALPRLALKVA